MSAGPTTPDHADSDRTAGRTPASPAPPPSAAPPAPVRATPPHRPPSLAAIYGMHCAFLSLASGLVGLAVSLLLWWRNDSRDIVRITEQAEIFSAAIGITLAGVALSSTRKPVRRVALTALIVNLAILSFVLDNMLSLFRG
jgi:hypothetical protein